MNKNIKYALFFTSGVTVGLGICGVKVLNYALNDEYLRDAINHKITDKVAKKLYGDIPKRNNSRVSYRNYYEQCKPYSYRVVDDLVFETEEEAEKIMSELEDTITKYGVATVADLYDLCGLSTEYTSNKYGWTTIRDFKIQRRKNSSDYELVAPDAKYLF